MCGTILHMLAISDYDTSVHSSDLLSIFYWFPVGLQYVKEYQQKNLRLEPFFMCELCRDRITSVRITAHIKSLKHNLWYMVRKSILLSVSVSLSGFKRKHSGYFYSFGVHRFLRQHWCNAKT